MTVTTSPWTTGAAREREATNEAITSAMVTLLSGTAGYGDFGKRLAILVASATATLEENAPGTDFAANFLGILLYDAATRIGAATESPKVRDFADKIVTLAREAILAELV